MYHFLRGERLREATYAEKKKYLERYYILKKEEQNFDTEIAIINDMYGLHAVTINGLPKSHNQADLSDSIIKIDEKCDKLRREYIKRREKAVLAGVEILNKINELADEDDKRILIQRHVLMQSMKSIAEKESYSRSGLDKRYRKAVNSIKLKI